MKYSNILCIGITGILGSNLYNSLTKIEGLSVYGTSRHANTADFLLRFDENFNEDLERIPIDFDLVINCVANTSSYSCDQSPSSAMFVNGLGPYKLYEYFQVSSKFVHVSSDSVFANSFGTSGKKYYPNSVYGYSKMLSEILLRNKPNCTILRLTLVGKSLNSNHGFLSWILDSINEKTTIQLYRNVYFSPVTPGNVLDYILTGKMVDGIVNLVSDRRYSKYEFGVAIAKKVFNSVEYIEPVNYIDNDDSNLFNGYDQCLNGEPNVVQYYNLIENIFNEINK